MARNDEERDDLARILADLSADEWAKRGDRSPVKHFARKSAERVLGAGYRKPHDCGTARLAYHPGYYRCGCGKLWRVASDNVAWCGWVEAKGLWAVVARVATSGIRR